MRFASFLSGGFITAIVVNPPERKLEKRTSVHCTTLYYSKPPIIRTDGILFEICYLGEKKKMWKAFFVN